MEVSFWNNHRNCRSGHRQVRLNPDVAALFTTGVLLAPQPTAADPEVARPRLRAAL